MRQKGANYLANIITFLSLLCGVASIILSIEGEFAASAWFIIACAVFDGLDGQIARRTAASGDFGREFDSLTDAICFGMAPFILGCLFIYGGPLSFGTILLFVYLICGLTRLARYNITPREKLASSFSGLPITISGGLFASFILIYYQFEMLLAPFILLLLIILLSYLMVSKINYLNLDSVLQILIRDKLLFFIIILILLAQLVSFYLFTSVFLPELSIFTALLIYLLFSPFMVKSVKISK